MQENDWEFPLGEVGVIWAFALYGYNAGTSKHVQNIGKGYTYIEFCKARPRPHTPPAPALVGSAHTATSSTRDRAAERPHPLLPPPPHQTAARLVGHCVALTAGRAPVPGGTAPFRLRLGA